MNFTTPGFTLRRNDRHPICKNQPFPLFLKSRRSTFYLLRPSFSLSCLLGRRFLLFSHSFDKLRSSILRRISIEKGESLHAFFSFSEAPPFKHKTGTLLRARLIHMIHTAVFRPLTRPSSTALTAILSTALLSVLRTCRSSPIPRCD